MKMLISICLAFCLCVLPLSSSFADVNTFFELPCAENELKFIFFNESTVIIKVANKTILIDPSSNIRKKTIEKLESNGLDLLMFTHDHYDHYDYQLNSEYHCV
jgi:beta-lactamase superfamily II metal-dependent hydrolase